MHELRRALEVLRDEGPRGLSRRARRRLGGGQADVFRDYARWLAAAAPAPPPATRPGADLRVSVVTPVCDPPPAALQALLRSLRAQEHAGWELCLADDASRDPAVRRVLAGALGDPRVRLATNVTRRGIVATTNVALSLAQGDLVAFADHDDVLAPDALRRAADALAVEPAAGWAFSDEDKLDRAGRRFAPFFKPALDPTLLLRTNYVAHLLVARHDLARRLGGLRDGFDGAQDHDLALRLAEVGGRVAHLPHVLYHWRASVGSTAVSPAAKPGAHDAARRAIEAALARRGERGRVEPGAWLGSHRLRLEPRVAPGEVSVVVDAAVPPAWLATAGVLEVLAGAAGTAAGRAALAARARGRFVLFVGPVRPAPGALLELLGEADRPGVGFVTGAIACDGRLVELGLALGHGPHATVGPLEPGARDDDLGYFGLLSLPRSVSATSGLVLLVAREVLDALGGLDASAGTATTASVDLCLRGARAGLRVVATPEARFTLGAADRAALDLALGAAQAALAPRVAAAGDDPWSNPAFARGVARLALGPGPAEHAPRIA